MKCNKCGCASIKTRRNYTHGNKSKPMILRVCMKCGSTDIAVEDPRRRRGFRRR